MKTLTSDAPAPAGPVGDLERLATLAAYGVLDTPAEQNFDDLAVLAGELCDTPVALISFVAADRQWFKARLNFAPCETDLDRSVCRFALSEPDLLVIPDLEADPRTARNPLVTGEPHIRFYAGAPLRTVEGLALGSLCVIDIQPRPQGLSSRQAENLRRLARQVMGQLELRRAVGRLDGALARRDEAAQALAEGERRWRGLFEAMREGFLLAKVIRDAEGRIVDWRYLEVNGAWGELLGVDAKTVVGRTVREVLPDVEEEWIELAAVVDTGETISFTRQVGQLHRWYEGRANPIGDDLFTVLFLEVTERIITAKAMSEAGARRAALVELSECLRATLDPRAMSHLAASILSRSLKPSRAGYGSVDLRREVLCVVSDACAPGVPSIKGEHSFRDYGSFVDDLKAGRMVVIPDVAADPRTRDDADAFRRLGIAAFVNAPVMEHGQLTALTLVHYDQPRAIPPEEQAFIRAVADRTQVAIARLRAEEQQSVLNGEISHRLKNILAMVQAVATQTLKGRAEPEALKTFAARLGALGQAQDALLMADWREAELAELVKGALSVVGAGGRYTATGPSVRLGSRATLSTSLLLHELATNAQKHGALSRPAGRVRISWALDGEGETADLVLEWCEEGGPPAHEPERKGFGWRILHGGLAGTGGADLIFGEDGFSARFRSRRREVEQA